METWASDNDEAVRQECLTVDVENALQQAAVVAGWGHDKPGKSGYDRTERAVMLLAAEVRRLRALRQQVEFTDEPLEIDLSKFAGPTKLYVEVKALGEMQAELARTRQQVTDLTDQLHSAIEQSNNKSA